MPQAPLRDPRGDQLLYRGRSDLVWPRTILSVGCDGTSDAQGPDCRHHAASHRHLYATVRPTVACRSAVMPSSVTRSRGPDLASPNRRRRGGNTTHGREVLWPGMRGRRRRRVTSGRRTLCTRPCAGALGLCRREPPDGCQAARTSARTRSATASRHPWWRSVVSQTLWRWSAMLKLPPQGGGFHPPNWRQ